MYIDITGPDGNAFALLGIAKKCMKQMGKKAADIDNMMKDAMSGDYEHLLSVIQREIPVIEFGRGSEDDDSLDEDDEY